MINYYLITKPGIILGNLLTVTAGFLLATKGEMQFSLLITTLLGLAFIIASACVFNNFIDRQIDRKMERTKNRALAQGLISTRNAMIFATLLGLMGTLILYLFTNPLTVFVALTGFFVYVLLYSLWKRHTIYGTAIGSIAGAVPPVVGYCAVTNQFDLGALLLFLMMIFWQMPHFFAISLYHYKDYLAAEMPLLPIKKGIFRTKIHMAIYISCFILVTALFTLFNYTGSIYLIAATCLGLWWLLLSLRGFSSTDDQLWGRDMFRLSLVVIAAICVLIPFDVVQSL